MTSDRVSGTSNQIPSTDEIMPDVNHSGIYIFESGGAKMSVNEQSQQREG